MLAFLKLRSLHEALYNVFLLNETNLQIRLSAWFLTHVWIFCYLMCDCVCDSMWLRMFYRNQEKAAKNEKETTRESLTGLTQRLKWLTGIALPNFLITYYYILEWEQLESMLESTPNVGNRFESLHHISCSLFPAVVCKSKLPSGPLHLLMQQRLSSQHSSWRLSASASSSYAHTS